MTILDMRRNLRGTKNAPAFHTAATRSWEAWTALATPLWQRFIAGQVPLMEYVESSAELWRDHTARCFLAYLQLTA
jgi:hypothetical protein